jgi:hypothetical protein
MRPRIELLALALLCLGVIAGYCWITLPAIPQYGLLEPSQQHFNLLVAGFRSGQLSLKQEPPPELAKLADPYDPGQNARYRLHDASYFNGKYYIYYGVTPALILFWPYLALTGHYLAQKYAVAVFCSVGFLIGAALVWGIRRRSFPGVGAWTLLAMVLAVGAVNCTAFLLRRPEMYEVSTSCAFSMVMAALVAVWCSLGGGRRPLAWIALASLFFGLAVGARPTFLFGAACLLIPVARLLSPPLEPGNDRRRGWRLGLAAFAPLVSIGIGLAVYNYLRFGNPLEFGIKYLMMGKKVSTFFVFNWRYILLNLRLYFFQPARLMEYFPFVREAAVPPLDAGYGFTEDPFGVFVNIPFLLLAFAAPLAWRNPDANGTARLRRFASAVAWLALTSVGVLLTYVVASIRYEVDFTPYLTILAVLGVFGIEGYFAGHRRWRPLARLGWAGLLAVSVAFNFFGSCQHLGLLERQVPAEFQALSRFFNYSTYACNRLRTSMRASPAPDQPADGGRDPHLWGPVLLRIKSPRGAAGIREPLLVMGTTPGVLAIAFIRTVSEDQIVVGFQFTGLGLYECQPIGLKRKGPVDIAVSGPSLLPDLGDTAWKGIPYSEQLADLSLYSIAVNGIAVLQVHSLLDRPIDRTTPLLFGANPARDSTVAGSFTDQIMEHSRLDIGESLPMR